MDNTPTTMTEVLAWVFAVQAILYGVGRGLAYVMNRTSTPYDNTAYLVIQKLLTVLDMLTGNREHKNDPKPFQGVKNGQSIPNVHGVHEPHADDARNSQGSSGAPQ